jgi:hypothetical protein
VLAVQPTLVNLQKSLPVNLLLGSMCCCHPHSGVAFGWMLDERGGGEQRR